MKYTVDTLKRISGNNNEEQIIAGEFCREAISEAKKRAKHIFDICDLSSIVDAISLAQAKDALAGIRHLTVCAEDIASFHANSRLADVFQNLVKELAHILSSSESHYLWLCKLFPSNTAV